MPTREEAVSDYNSNTSGQRWAEGVQAKSDNYADGVASFLGTSPGNITRTSDWANSVQRDSARQAYEEGTSGKGDDWYAQYERAMQS